MNIQFKRIYSEQRQICERYNKCNINISSEYKNNNIEYKYLFNFNIDNKKLKLILEDNYPFAPPILYINDSLYNNMLIQNDKFILEELNNLNIDCLCCKTKLCFKNWSPAYKLLDIIDEYIEYSKIIKKIIYRKYLILINKSNDNILPQEILDIISIYL